MSKQIATNLGNNVRQLREARRMSQEQMSQLAGIPRPTWSNLESGSSNPTLTVLVKVANALQVPLEELIGPERQSVKLYRADSLPAQQRGKVRVRGLLPESIAGLQIDRMEFPSGAYMTGVPHTPGTREYLTCEIGKVQLSVAGTAWELDSGDVLVFRGDQKHAYRNLSSGTTVAYSVVALAPVVE
ncbi:MAG TPA: helix-turn-helix domain-containing protein [Terriglobia bacterium]|nr:helix-turn-helix domain-containing protein [Terriglobia bacterium]